MATKTIISLLVVLALFFLFGTGSRSFSNPPEIPDLYSLALALERAEILMDTYRTKDFKTRYGLHSQYYRSVVPYSRYLSSFGLIYPEDVENMKDPHVSGASMPTFQSEKDMEGQMAMAGIIPSVVWKDQIRKMYFNPEDRTLSIEHLQSFLIKLQNLFGSDPINSTERDRWKMDYGDWVFDRDKKDVHISGSPEELLKGYSEIDFDRISENLLSLAERETELNRFGRGVDLFKTYLKLDILNHYRQVPDQPDTVRFMKQGVLRERLIELDKLAAEFPNTNELKIDLLRSYHLLGETPSHLPPEFVEGVNPDNLEELVDLSNLSFQLKMTGKSVELYQKAMGLNLYWNRILDLDVEQAARGKGVSPAGTPVTLDEAVQMALKLIQNGRHNEAGEILAHSLQGTESFGRFLEGLRKGPPSQPREYRLDQILPPEFSPYYGRFSYFDLREMLSPFGIALVHPADPAWNDGLKIPFDLEIHIVPYRVIGIYVFRQRINLLVNGRNITDLLTSHLIALELDPRGNEVRRGIFDLKNENHRQQAVEFFTGFQSGNYSLLISDYLEPQPVPEVENVLHLFGAAQYGAVRNFVSYIYLNSIPPVQPGLEIVDPDPVHLHLIPGTPPENGGIDLGTGSVPGRIAAVRLEGFKPDSRAEVRVYSSRGPNE